MSAQPTGLADPIGVFDSGVGGLSILKAIRRALPHENLVYVADSAHAPYGDREPDFIVARATAITGWLLARGAKAVVIACNTASSLAVDRLRTGCPVPIIGMEPAIAPAARRTRSGIVGVLATTRTVASPAVERLCATFGRDVEIVLQGCPGLVENVERGELVSASTRRLLERYLAPSLAAGADALVLGCTHYAFLGPTIREIAGPDVLVIDSAEAVARQLVRRLGEHDAIRTAGAPGEQVYSNGPAERWPLVSTLWGSPVAVASFDEGSAATASERLTARPTTPPCARASEDSTSASAAM